MSEVVSITNTPVVVGSIFEKLVNVLFAEVFKEVVIPLIVVSMVGILSFKSVINYD